jgi:hypothetical protein
MDDVIKIGSKIRTLYECPKGHTFWTQGEGLSKPLKGQGFGWEFWALDQQGTAEATVRTGPICPYCFVDFMRQFVAVPKKEALVEESASTG